MYPIWLYKKKIKNTTKSTTLVVLTTGFVLYIVTRMQNSGLQKCGKKYKLQIHMRFSNRQITPYKIHFKEVFK